MFNCSYWATLATRNKESSGFDLVNVYRYVLNLGEKKFYIVLKLLIALLLKVTVLTDLRSKLYRLCGMGILEF